MPEEKLGLLGSLIFAGLRSWVKVERNIVQSILQEENLEPLRVPGLILADTQLTAIDTFLSAAFG